MYWYSNVPSSTLVIENSYLNQALYFNTSSSCFQIKTWTSTYATNQAFSVSLWIKPAGSSIINDAVLVPLSVHIFRINSPCCDLLGLTVGGILITQISPSVSTVKALQDPVLIEDVWTHIVLAYGQTYRMHLWINRTLLDLHLMHYLL
ncbi:unnamed protein product [Rotaria sp. Silwood2]|nr:unnamed protein product [Rotaria sp. Silwood2]CAF2711435.1 unnamed protein product [Rotaria sp. Silwood2]CAF2984488.1 unnamed protein product [Rotaria sp. Silwood2]CAF3140658.1 unnamed protein product [Rotaria sp. Silwood2]CAF3904972.1 unnamed protein product [Rotaria sp. Silwood2]